MTVVVNKETLVPFWTDKPQSYPLSNYWRDPDLSAVGDVALIYWKESGGIFSEMTESEKAIKDAKLAAAAIVAGQLEAKNEIDNKRVLRAFAEVVVDEINILRAQHSLADRTLSQLVTAIKNKIDEN